MACWQWSLANPIAKSVGIEQIIAGLHAGSLARNASTGISPCKQTLYEALRCPSQVLKPSSLQCKGIT
eukprot:7231300-Pyramimonas_sp.AAC.1